MKNSKNFLNEEEISKAYEFDIFESLTSNLTFLNSKFISYNENSFNIEKCQLMFFTKINVYLLYIIFIVFQKGHSMIKHIKYIGRITGRSSLKIVKQY